MNDLLNKNMNKPFLPAEWHKQSLIQLTWPHANSDWAYMLEEVNQCFVALATEILALQKLLIVTPGPQQVMKLLREGGANLSNVIIEQLESNDTWARDHAFITLLQADRNPLLMDFCFNGWGMKFAANHDNQINRQLYATGKLKGAYGNYTDFVLEGGSIESDGEGTILTTAHCLLAPNRNEKMDKSDIELYLKESFYAKQILWLHHGYLAGDDTDSHVDTLARLCPNHTIAYVQCNDKEDEHYEELKAMEEELKAFRTLAGEPYRLLPLPMAAAAFDSDGERLPATYANFLIMNEAVLCPTYQEEDLDAQAMQVLAEAFPGRKIVGVDCSALIQQHGSLHCVTMQFPEGVF
ncbi:MAG: agmatine deiminase family protein [Phocaeicola sp.]